MPPKRQDVEGDSTPNDDANKKKDDTTPTPVVDKDVTPSEDDKGQKDPTSSSNKKTGTTSKSTQLTELTELSSGSRRNSRAGAGKLKETDRPRRPGRFGSKARVGKDKVKLNKSLKQLKKSQAKKSKHPRSFQSSIMKILRQLNDVQIADGLPAKHCSALSMMIFDSFANDLGDKVINQALELVRQTGKKQLTSSDIITGMKLVLPADMAHCCEEACRASIANYKESRGKHTGKLGKFKDSKKGGSSKKDPKE
jgi:hypothetical protein